jgi:hypothetical protein
LIAFVAPGSGSERGIALRLIREVTAKQQKQQIMIPVISSKDHFQLQLG